MLRNNVGISQGKLPVEDVEEFPFHTADIALSKHPGPCGPISILR